MNTTSRHCRWTGTAVVLLVVCAAAAGGNGALDSIEPSSPFSSTPEYQSIRAELARGAPRPSRISGSELARKSVPVAALEASETAEAWQLETALWRLTIQKAPWQLSLTNKQTGAAWRLAPAGSHRAGIWWTDAGGEPPPTALRIKAVESIQKQDHGWKIQAALEDSPRAVALEVAVLSPHIIRLSIEAPHLGQAAYLGLSFVGGGPFLGLGERFLQARLDGLQTTLRPEDVPWQPGHNWTYIPVPLLFSPGGLGLYFDTAWPTTFDLSKATQRHFSIQVAGPTTDCYLLAGPNPKTILSAYTSLTGRPPVPPPWAFGIWIDSRQGKHSVLQDAHRLRQLGIPVSAIWVHDFMDHQTNLGFPLWTSGFWGAPRQLTAELHQLGYKVLAYRSSYVRSVLAPYLLANPVFEEGTRNGFFVRKPDGQPAGPTFEPVLTGNIDFTKPAAVDWWQKMIRQSLLAYDFDGWMEDFGEWIKDDHQFDVGKNGRQMANLYPLLYHLITYRIARQCKPDFVGFARSGYAGSQANTCAIWGGDQLPDWSLDNGLPAVVTAGITAGLCGFATWGPDILSRGTSKELWIRWAQFGALTPIMRDHVWEKPKFSVDLWFDSETLDTFRRYARLHISLFPYFYTYAHQAAATGWPIIRHLLLEWPEDPQAWTVEHQYMLGEKILVAPVITAGAMKRRLYLPKGEWANYWTGEVFTGGQHLDIPAPLEQIPILVRAGSVIPLMDAAIETLAQDLARGKYRTLDQRLTWRVFPALTATQDRFLLYDGTRVVTAQEAQRIQVNGADSPGLRSWEVVLPAASEPSEVMLSGQRLEKLDDTGYRAGKQGWWRDRTLGILRAQFTRTDFVLNVKLQ